MRSWALARVAELSSLGLCGFILKRNSPSCGLIGVKLYPRAGGEPALLGVGLFAQALKERFPGLPLADEEMLRDPAAVNRFLAQAWGLSRP
jgi:uncharacterized protein YbbK (DUF523 family)